MYQRMLNKQEMPTVTQMEAYCGETGPLFSALNKWLSDTCPTEQKIVFPYGSTYGWGIAYRKKGRLICNVFAEDNAFTVMLRLTNEQWAELYNQAQEYMRGYIDNKYPCGEGGWIHYRVTCREQLADIMRALLVRCS